MLDEKEDELNELTKSVEAHYFIHKSLTGIIGNVIH